MPSPIADLQLKVRSWYVTRLLTDGTEENLRWELQNPFLLRVERDALAARLRRLVEAREGRPTHA